MNDMLENGLSKAGVTEKDGKKQRAKPTWYSRLLTYGMYGVLAYGGLAAFRGIVCNDIEETIVPGRAYKVVIEQECNSFNIFSINRRRYETTRNFNKDSTQNMDSLEIIQRGFKKSLVDMDADGLVDVINVSENGSSKSLVRAVHLKDNAREFEDADKLLAQTRETYEDFISEIEERAMLGM